MAQVGRTSDDHSYWGRPEQLDTARPVYYVTEEFPGAEIAGQLAATFASGALLLRNVNPDYAMDLYNRAKERV